MNDDLKMKKELTYRLKSLTYKVLMQLSSRNYLILHTRFLIDTLTSI